MTATLNRRAHAREARGLRVAFYCDARTIGGAEFSLANLLGQLSPRIEASVVGTSASVLEMLSASRPGTETVLVPYVERKRQVRAILAHVRAVRRLRPHVLHLNLNSPWASHWGIVAGLLSPGTRMVVTMHTGPNGPPRRRQLVFRRLVSRFLSAQVAVGRSTGDAYADAVGISRGSVRTIANGVPDVPLQRFPRPSAGPVIGTIARLEPEKGLDVLIRAVAELPGVTAVLVSDGRERGVLASLAADLDVSDRVLFTGWVPDARSYLTTLDLFVLPSRLEGLPLVIVEAMLAGLPVVATDVGSVREVVVHGETGLLVAPGDPRGLAEAIGTLLDDERLRLEMGRAGRRRAEDFTLETMAAAYEALYDEVVG